MIAELKNDLIVSRKYIQHVISSFFQQTQPRERRRKRKEEARRKKGKKRKRGQKTYNSIKKKDLGINVMEVKDLCSEI